MSMLAAASAKEQRPAQRKRKREEDELERRQLERLRVFEWENVKGYWCNVCKVKFAASADLIEHMATAVHKK